VGEGGPGDFPGEFQADWRCGRLRRCSRCCRCCLLPGWARHHACNWRRSCVHGPVQVRWLSAPPVCDSGGCRSPRRAFGCLALLHGHEAPHRMGGWEGEGWEGEGWKGEGRGDATLPCAGLGHASGRPRHHCVASQPGRQAASHRQPSEGKPFPLPPGRRHPASLRACAACFRTAHPAAMADASLAAVLDWPPERFRQWATTPRMATKPVSACLPAPQHPLARLLPMKVPLSTR
jgi:hypothetical protein